MAGELIRLDALGPAGAFRARNRVSIPDVRGAPAAELSLVPTLFVSRAMSALHKAVVLSEEERTAALARAGRLFREGVVGGLSFADYADAVSRVAGLPVSFVREAADELAKAADRARFNAYRAQPVGATQNWRQPDSTRRGVWTRRGKVFAVHAAGNHPAPHTVWLEALALGYHVAIRPSRREPFTAHRLVSALWDAGFGSERVVLLPTNHAVADEVLRGADLGIVYGGDEVVRKYAVDATVAPRGPGRSKILLTADVDWREHLDTIVDSIAHHGGVKCIDTSAVLIEGDPAPLAAAIAERLDALPSLPPEDDKAVLPVQPLASARTVEQYLFNRAEGSKPWLGGNGVVDEMGDGSAVLRPAVYQLDTLDHGNAVSELPFPCVWVAPWSPDAGIAPLTDSLVLTAITGNHALVDDLIAEPTISNVYLGDHPTYLSGNGLPHDDYLGTFLMRAKSVIGPSPH
jgi:acyl-CoA reductase-like NAD-dependent aldehyde dehydrogenase